MGNKEVETECQCYLSFSFIFTYLTDNASLKFMIVSHFDNFLAADV